MRMSLEQMEELISGLQALDYSSELKNPSIDSPSAGNLRGSCTDCRADIMAHTYTLQELKSAIAEYLVSVKDSFVDADEKGA